MRFLEIILCIVLFPIMLILGLILGLVKIYRIFDSSFWNTIGKRRF